VSEVHTVVHTAALVAIVTAYLESHIHVESVGKRHAGKVVFAGTREADQASITSKATSRVVLSFAMQPDNLLESVILEPPKVLEERQGRPVKLSKNGQMIASHVEAWSGAFVLPVAGSWHLAVLADKTLLLGACIRNEIRLLASHSVPGAWTLASAACLPVDDDMWWFFHLTRKDVNMLLVKSAKHDFVSFYAQL
jgi:hypothetical protein